MKRKFVASLAAAMVLGIAGTSFAATNPFTDVPAEHWAYASVLSLSQAGLVDGYGDATYKGDKTMTRYEMAQMVAKAMAHSDKADAKQKAVISKLAVEFASELEGLNVRVGTLEKNQPNFKITGSSDIRYSNKDFETAANANKGTSGDYRFRLDGTAKVDDKTTIGVRLVNNSPEQNAANGVFGLGQNKSWTKFGNDGGKSTVDLTADRLFINTKVGEVDTTIGRQKLSVGTTAAIVDSGIGTFDGLKLATQLGNVNAAVSYGRLPGYTDPSTAETNQKDIQVAELGTSFGKLSGNVGYYGIKNNAATGNIVALPGGTNELLKLYYANGKYQFNNKFSINTEFGENKAGYATNNNKFYDVFATLGDQTLTKAKQHNIQARYYYAGKNALALDAAGNGLNTFNEGVKFGPDSTTFTSDSIKAASVLYNYAFSNNLTGQVGYYIGKSSNYADGNYKMLRTVLSAKF